MQTETKKRSLKKKAAAVVSVALALAISLGGTYMWRDYTQHKTNQLKNSLPKYETVLVEDFEEKDDWTTADGELKKEISVKNTGNAAKGYVETYARIQLKEYMEIRPMIIEQTEDRYMIDTSGAYIVFNTKSVAQAAYPDAPDWVELTDAVSEVTGWFVQTKENDDNGQYGKFVTTKYELSDTVNKITPGIDRTDDDAKKSNKHDVVADGEEPHRNGECDYRKYLWDADAENPTMEYIKWLLNDDDIVLLSEWDNKPGAFWIIDDTADNDNPWIYWGEAIFPGVETADFMKTVELVQQPDGDFYYALHVEMQALSLDELFGNDPQWTDMSAGIKTSYQENAPQVILDFGQLQAPYTIRIGETLPAPNVTVKPDSVSQDVTWKISNPKLASIDGDGNITGLAPGEVTVTVTAANGKKATFSVTVSNEKTLWQQLQDLLNEAAQLDETDYTPDSWTLLDNALDLANTVSEDSADNVLQSVIDAIESAIAALVRNITPADELQEKIDAGKAILGDRNLAEDKSASGTGSANPYTPDSLDTLQEAVEAAEELLAKTNPAATNEELEAAVETIENAIDGLVYKASKAVLYDRLAEANALEEDDYTTSTWGPFETALAAANAVYNDPNATAQQISDTISNLQAAKNALEERGSTAALNTLIGQAQNVTPQENYTTDTWGDLQSALTAATNALANNGAADLTQDEIDALAEDLQDALTALVDLGPLKTLIASTVGLTEENYTPDSWDALETALTAANEAATPNQNKTQGQVTTATENLQDAIDGLVPVSNKAALETVLTGHPKLASGYTTSSWTDSGYQAAYDAANALLTNLNDGNSANDPTPAAIKAAIEALEEAQDDLVSRGNPSEINSLATSIQNAISGKQADYTANSWNALQNALTAAGNGNLDVSNLTQGQVDALKTALETAYSDMVDISALNTAIATANAKVQADYTPASWAAFITDKAAAEGIAAKPNATQAEVNTATTNLTNAINNLVLKPVVNTFNVSSASTDSAAVFTNQTTDKTVTLQENASVRTITLTGNVGGTNLSDPATTWSKSGNQASAWGAAAGDAETYLITIGANETGTITVTAKAIDDNSKSLTITVNVLGRGPHATHPVPAAQVVDASLPQHRISATDAGDTADWVAIAKQNVAGQDYYLIVRTKVIGNSTFDGDASYTNNYNSADSDLNIAMTNYWNSLSGSAGLKFNATNHNALTTLGADYKHGYNNQYLGFSAPVAVGGTSGVFPLSADEAAEYMSSNWENVSSITKYNTSDESSTGTKLTAYTNWETLSDKTSFDSWLRSPHASSSNSAAILSAAGGIRDSYVYLSAGVRPALWVKADIFN